MEISFKPGLIIPPKTWKIVDNQLTTPKGKIFDLGSITAAHFINMPVKRRWTTELKLTSPDDSVNIVCNDAPTGQQRYQYFVLIAAILKNLQAHNPNLQIRYGYGQTTNYIFACMGLIPLGFGLSFIWESITNEFDKFPLGMGIGFILLGAFWVWCISPWQASARYAPQQLLTLLSQQSNVPL